MPEAKRQLAAIMFTDIVGYTALMGKSEQQAMALLHKNREIQKHLIGKYNGRWIKEMGDGTLSSFNTITDAVLCANEIQIACKDVAELKLRIGIHQGEVVFEGEDVFGDGVNIASRIEASAQEGEIIVSEAVYQNIKNKEGIQTEFIKEEQLKNVEEPVKIYRINVQDVVTERVEIVSELRRRLVLRASFVYILAALVFWKVADIIFGLFNLSENIFQIITLVLIVIFPIAVLMAWLYERSPQGFIRTGATTSKDNPFSDAQKKPLTSNTFILLLVATVASLFLIYPQKTIDSNITIGSDHKSIAVLAFDDQSPNGDQEWLGDGMADEILNILAKVEGLKVSGKTSSFSYKGKGATIQEIGETLDVKTVLEGSVSKVSGKLRITAQLIDVETEAHIWSDKYDRDAEDIFAIVDEVAQSIVGSLMSELSNEEVEDIKMGYQPNPEAYEYLIKADNIHNEFLSAGYDNDLFLRSKDFYFEAISIDPNYMDAMAGLADLYDTRGNIRDLQEESDRVRDSILNVAYEIDPESPYTLFLKGYVNSNMDSAISFFKKAYDIDPHSKGVGLLMEGLRSLGLYAMAIKLCKKFLANDPLNQYIQGELIQNLFRIGQFEEARKQIIKYMNFHDDIYHYRVLNSLFLIKLLIDQDTIEVKRIAKKLEQFRPGRGNSFRKALILAVEGRKEEALAENSSIRVKMLLGMNSEVLSIMESRISNANRPFINNSTYLYLKSDPNLDNIRGEPQFQQWLKEAKIVHEERVRKYYHLFDD